MCHLCQRAGRGPRGHSTTSGGTPDSLPGPPFPSRAIFLCELSLCSLHLPCLFSPHPKTLLLFTRHGHLDTCRPQLMAPATCVFISPTPSTPANSFLPSGPLHMLRLSSAWNVLPYILAWLVRSVPLGLSQMMPFLRGLLWPPGTSSPLPALHFLLSTDHRWVSSLAPNCRWGMSPRCGGFCPFCSPCVPVPGAGRGAHRPLSVACPDEAKTVTLRDTEVAIPSDGRSRPRRLLRVPSGESSVSAVLLSSLEAATGGWWASWWPLAVMESGSPWRAQGRG